VNDLNKINKTFSFYNLPTRHSWFLTLAAISVTEIGVFSNQPVFKAIASFVLVALLPGYCLSRLLYGSRISIWTIVFSSVASLFTAMLIALPSMIVYGEMIRLPLALSFGLFCVGCFAVEWFLKPQPQTSGALRIDLFFLIITITFILLQVIYLFLGRNLEPSIPDWAYEVGMITQLRQFPATHPEAAWTLLKQPWGYWGVYALLVTLTGLRAMTVLKIVSIILAIILLSLIYILCSTFFDSPRIGAWAAFFFATTSEIKWLLKSIVNRRLMLSRMAQGSVQTSGGNLMLAWYNIPALIGSVFVVYFALCFYRNGEKADWIIALVAATILPFFHPTFYGMTMGGLVLFILIKRGWKRDLGNWLAFIITIIPFAFVYKILYESSYTPIPLSPVLSLGGIRDNLIWYVAYCGLLIPLALLSVVRAKDKASYIGPFALVPSVLTITTYNIADNYHWYYDIHAVWLAVLASIGLVELGKAKTRVYQVGYVALIGFTVLTVTPLARIVPRAIQNYRFPPWFQDSDYDVAKWIRTRTDTEDVFLTVPESSTTLVVEGLAERRVVYGYTMHLRTTEPPDELLLVQTEIRNMFCASDESLVRSLLDKYSVAYVIIGPDERTFLSDALSGCRPILPEITTSVYQNSDYELLEIIHFP
jgi:hypothetical protein